MTLLLIAASLLVLWIVVFGAVHVTAWVVHLLVLAAIVCLIVWLVQYLSGRRV